MSCRKLIFLSCCLIACVTVFVQTAAQCDKIHDAAKSGDMAAIEKLLNQDKALVNKKDSTPIPITVTVGKGWTALHWAAFTGHANVVAALLKKGANANAVDTFGYTPLHFAMNREVAGLLIKNGAKVAAKSDSNGWTPLHRAAFASNKEVAQLLVAEGADVNAKDKLGNAALYYAAGWSHSKELAQLLITKGADVNAQDKGGWTPLHYAAYAGNADMVKLLIAHKAKVNVEDNFGQTPLSQAKAAGRTDVVKILKAAGAK